MRAGGMDGPFERNAFYSFISCPQQMIGAILYPRRHIGIGRTSIGWVVLEASILGRIVRRRDDDAIGQMFFSIPVVNENRARDDGCWCDSILFLNDSLNTACSQH